MVIDPKLIPPEAHRAAQSVMRGDHKSGDADPLLRAIAAALSAWPGVSCVPGLEQWGKVHGAHIHLPLPQKDGDA